MVTHLRRDRIKLTPERWNGKGSRAVVNITQGMRVIHRLIPINQVKLA